MAITTISANVLASGAALTNLNAGASIDLTKNVSMSGNLAVDTNTLFVNSTNNRVGIGTTSPSCALTIKSPSTSGSVWDALYSGSTNPIFRLEETGNGSTGQMTMYTSGGGVSIRFAVGGNSFLASGNFGIGTTNPLNPLHIAGTGNTSAIIESTADLDAQFMFKTNGSLKSLIGHSNSSGLNGFRIYNYGTSATELFIPYSTGNIGIGTTTPNEKLTVAGNISATGTLTTTGKATLNGQGALLSLTANDAITKDILGKHDLLGTKIIRQTILPHAGWPTYNLTGGNVSAVGSYMQLITTTTQGSVAHVDVGPLWLSSLGANSATGYSVIDWTRSIAVSFWFQFGYQASYAGQQFLFYIGGVETAVVAPMVGSQTGSNLGGIGVLLTMTSATAFDIRLVSTSSVTNVNTHAINSASNPRPATLLSSEPPGRTGWLRGKGCASKT